MACEALEPCELVVEFGPRLRIAVRCVERSDQHAVDGCLDVAALRIVGIARQVGAGDDRRRSAREDCDAVPALLAAPDRLVAGLAQRIGREFRVRGFQLLQADDVGFCPAQPFDQVRQAAPDIVDVEARDLHGVLLPPRRVARHRQPGSRALQQVPCILVIDRRNWSPGAMKRGRKPRLMPLPRPPSAACRPPTVRSRACRRASRPRR